MEAAFDRLTAEGVSICNGDQWCEFIDRRDAVRTLHEPRGEGAAACTVSGLAGHAALMVPAAGKPRRPGQIVVNGRMAEGMPVRRLE
jgi:hypothetical protein